MPGKNLGSLAKIGAQVSWGEEFFSDRFEIYVRFKLFSFNKFISTMSIINFSGFILDLKPLNK